MLEINIKNNTSGINIPMLIENQAVNINFRDQNKMFKIVYISNGSGIVELNSQKILVTSPHIFCLNEKDKLNVIKEKSITFKIVYFHPSVVNSNFDLKFIYNTNREFVPLALKHDLFWLEPFMQRNEKYNGSFLIGPFAAKKTENFISSFEDEFEKQEGKFWPCRGRSYFIEFLFYLSRLHENSDLSTIQIRNEYKFFEDILLFIHTNYNQKITLADICKKFSLNRTTLNELFSKHTGDSTINYIKKLRLKLAALFLKDTHIPVYEIAERVGYYDITNFGRAFKKNFGTSPSDYRKSNI